MKNSKSKSSIFLKAALYTICILIVAFYITMLVFGKNPKVGLEYNMYYITHELIEWPGYDKLAYVPGTEEFFSYAESAIVKPGVRRGQGWDIWEEKEYHYSKTNGSKAYIYYVMPKDAGPYTMRVKLLELTGKGDVSVYANGTLLGKMNEGVYDCSFYIPKEIEPEENTGLLTIHFEMNDSAFKLESILIE